MLTVTVLQLVGMLLSHVGATFASFTARTRPTSFRKNGVDAAGNAIVNPHYKQLLKLSKVNILADFDYQRRVNKVRAQAGDAPREVGAPTNGFTKIPGTVCGYYPTTGKVCLWCEVRSVGETELRNELTGAIVDPAELAPFKPARDTEILYCTYGLDTIVAANVNGEAVQVDQTTYNEARLAVLGHAAELGLPLAAAA